MLNRKITTVIDQDKCNGCGICVKVCPADTISMVQEKAKITGSFSLGCGHCESACPVGAIKVESLDDESINFSTFDMNNKWSAPGKYDLPDLVRLMASRRSCRNYKDKEIDKQVLEDLVKIGCTSPSGSNEQVWKFTILPDRRSVTAFAKQVASFFQRLNKQSENLIIRKGLKLIGKPELDNYYMNYHDVVEDRLKRYKEQGVDGLFHSAPAVIVVSTGPGLSTPKEDAILATQNILLAAHAMGLGTCLIGLAIAAMYNDKSLPGFIGLSKNENPHTVIAIGYPDEKYHTVIRRKMPEIRYFQDD